MRLRKFLYLYLALWLAFPCIVIIIWMMDYNLLIGTTGTAFRIQGILNCIAAVCGITLAFLHYRETEKALKNKITLAAIAAGTAFLLLCGNFLCIFSGQVTLYEWVDPFLIYPKERIITDDGYRPVCAGEYSLVWQGDTVTLSVANGAGGNETISVTLDEHR